MMNTLMSSARTANGRATGSTDNWSTPPDLYEWFLERFRVTIDPCCGPDSTNQGKVHWWGPEQDGLKASWTFVGTPAGSPKQVAFVNPPYSQLKLWAAKALGKLTEQGCLDGALFLIPARTDTVAFRMLAKGARAIWFFPRRLKFVRAGGEARDTAPFPSAAIWLNRQPYDTKVYFADPRENEPQAQEDGVFDL